MVLIPSDHVVILGLPSLLSLTSCPLSILFLEELLRGLVTYALLDPAEFTQDGHHIVLYRELAAILELSGPTNDEPRRITGGVSVIVGCG
ncbi:hypothetical protein SAMN02745667_01630, partial [Nereida ignava DSM 16309]